MNIRNALFVLLIFLSVFACSGMTVRGSGSVKEVSKDLAPFHSVTLSGKGIIHFVHGQQHSMTIRAEENIMRIMDVEIDDEEMEISYDHDFVTENVPEFFITLPDLNRIEIDGMARVSNEGTFPIERLAVNISGKAKCDLDIKGGTIELRLGGNAIVNLRGECETIRVSITGMADVAAQQLRAQRAVVRLMGHGNTELYVEEFLDVELNGAGSVTYLGSPELKTRINGSGTISASKEQPAASSLPMRTVEKPEPVQNSDSNPPAAEQKAAESVDDGSGNGKEKASGGSQ